MVASICLAKPYRSHTCSIVRKGSGWFMMVLLGLVGYLDPMIAH
jgi:hypothetical protein